MSMSAKEQNKFHVSTLLSADRVLIVPDAAGKAELIERLVRAVCKDEPSLDCADILAQVLKREEGISTTLDTGLSIPHARLEEINDFKAALAVIPAGVDDPNSNLQIKAMFLFLSPAKQLFFQKHLQILSGLAETFKADFIEELLKLQTPQEIVNRITAK